MREIRLSASRRRVYNLLTANKSVSRAAEIMNISRQAVHKHKKGLLAAGYIRSIPGTVIFEKGPNAKFLDVSTLSSDHVIKEKAVSDMQGVPTSPSFDRQDPQASTSVERSNRVEEAVVETLRAHMHGEFVFPVEKVGDRSFFEGSPFNRTNGVDMFAGSITPISKDWTCSVRLCEGVKSKSLIIWPPEVRLIAKEIESDALARNGPQQFFEVEIYELIDLLEKNGWRFARDKGRRVGRFAGQVSFGYDNPYVMQHVPQDLCSFDGVHGHIDHSCGGAGEMEFQGPEGLQNAYMLITAKDQFAKRDAAIGEIKDRVGRHEDELLHARKATEDEFIMVYRKLSELGQAVLEDIELRTAKTRGETIERARQILIDQEIKIEDEPGQKPKTDMGVMYQ